MIKPEIERKFLLNPSKIPVDLNTLEKVNIEQGYLLWNTGGDEARLRKIYDRYLLTFKTGSGKSRMETEIEISPEQFGLLWPLTGGKRLFKTRYFFKNNDHLIEIDVYSGKARGLIVAEIEFRNMIDCESYTPPDWFGREVSEDESFRNRNLAME